MRHAHYLLSAILRVARIYSMGLLFLTLIAFQSAGAADLVMFEAKGCHVCKKFNETAGKDYATSAVAKVLPLRRLDLHDDKPDFALKLPVTMTPTFVFVSNGAEITRFVGYPGRKYFYQIVDAAAEELSKRPANPVNTGKAKP